MTLVVIKSITDFVRNSYVKVLFTQRLLTWSGSLYRRHHRLVRLGDGLCSRVQEDRPIDDFVLKHLNDKFNKPCKPSDNCATSPASCWCGLLCLWVWRWPLLWWHPNPPNWSVPAAACSNWWPWMAQTALYPATEQWIAPCACRWLCHPLPARCKQRPFLPFPMPCNLLQRRILRRLPRRRCLLADLPYFEP